MSITDVQSWLDELPGNYTIQRLRNGQVLVSLQMGSMSTSFVRGTFTEAATECMAAAEATKRSKRVG
ncbi:MAG TPA: hypothetical protein VM537_17455 [Anaerolineae bacterium]|nr:hypothetical protein [Anaerolineae bacterium]